MQLLHSRLLQTHIEVDNWTYDLICLLRIESFFVFFCLKCSVIWTLVAIAFLGNLDNVCPLEIITVIELGTFQIRCNG